MKIGFTGHRPQKVFYKHDKVYTQECFDLLYNFISNYLFGLDNKRLHELLSYCSRTPNYNVGGALGFDTVIAEYLLKTNLVNLYLPYKTFGSHWYSKVDKERLERHKRLANKVIYVSEDNTYAKRLMMERNAAIVDNSDVIIALWDGSNSGTKNCINYAKKQKKEVINIWEDWVRYYEV